MAWRPLVRFFVSKGGGRSVSPRLIGLDRFLVIKRRVQIELRDARVRGSCQIVAGGVSELRFTIGAMLARRHCWRPFDTRRNFRCGRRSGSLDRDVERYGYPRSPGKKLKSALSVPKMSWARPIRQPRSRDDHRGPGHCRPDAGRPRAALAPAPGRMAAAE